MGERGRPVLGPVLLATLFLAVIGASVGYALGAQAPADGRQRPDQAGVLTQPPVEESPSPAERSEEPADPPTSAPTGEPCPRPTEDLAAKAGSAGDLVQILYVRTRESEVWICADRDGELYYQGHRGPPGEPLKEGANALFLTDVIRDGEEYVATNSSGSGRTRYRVSADRLVIENPDGTETEPAEYHE